MDNYCADCKHLSRKETETYKNWYTGKTTYKCHKNGEYHKLDSNACSEFEPFKDFGSYTPSGCYITTIVCEILGYDDDCDLLKIFRSFREDVLKANEDYIPLLMEYDQVGPEISNAIRRNANRDYIAIDAYNTFLKPCLKCINNNEIEKAISIYKFMLAYLKSRLGINAIEVNYADDYDIETLGKGRIKKLSTNE